MKLITVTEAISKHNVPKPIAQALYAWTGDLNIYGIEIPADKLDRLYKLMSRATDDMVKDDYLNQFCDMCQQREYQCRCP